jgi:hypothetical protein
MQAMSAVYLEKFALTETAGYSEWVSICYVDKINWSMKQV